MMEYLRIFLLKNFRTIFIICVGLTCLLYIYCSPLSGDELLEILKGSLLYIGFSIFMYLSVLLNCFTGAYEFFNKVPYVKYSVFIMLGSIFAFLFVFGFVSTILTRNFEIYSFTMPALIGAYIGGKSVDCIDKRTQD